MTVSYWAKIDKGISLFFPRTSRPALTTWGNLVRPRIRLNTVLLHLKTDGTMWAWGDGGYMAIWAQTIELIQITLPLSK